MAKISVIIPTYKRSEFLDRAIKSVLSQSFTDFEIIIVDDNGRGNKFQVETGNNIQQLYGDNPKIKYIINEINLGGAGARNEGIKKSKGKYITFLDDDDIYLPDKLALQWMFMEEQNLEMTFSNCIVKNDQNVVVEEIDYNLDGLPSYKDLLKMHLMNHIGPTDSFMFKKDKLIEIGGFEKVNAGQEYILALKSIVNKLRMGYLKECQVVQYFHNGERISTGNKKIKAQKELIGIKKKYFDVLNFFEKRAVMSRHYTVLGFIYYKNHSYLNTIIYSLLALMENPLFFIKILLEKKKMLRN